MAVRANMGKKDGAVLTAPQSVVFSLDERREVRHAAYLSEQSVSAFIRAAAVKAAARVVRQNAAENLKAAA